MEKLTAADERTQSGMGAEPEAEPEGGSAIADGIRRDVRPWLNLVDDLSNLTRDAEISVPQVCVSLNFATRLATPGTW